MHQGVRWAADPLLLVPPVSLAASDVLAGGKDDGRRCWGRTRAPSWGAVAWAIFRLRWALLAAMALLTVGGALCALRLEGSSTVPMILPAAHNLQVRRGGRSGQREGRKGESFACARERTWGGGGGERNGGG